MSENRIKENFIDVNGINTHYWEQGEGKPLLFIHGGGAGADALGNWKGVIPLFAQKFRVLALDMIGFGHTDKPDPETVEYSTDTRIKHILGFIEALGLENVTLLGNSMGGIASIGASLRSPKIDKLVLIGSPGLRYQRSSAVASIREFELTREKMRSMVTHLTSASFHADEELIDYRLRLMEQPGAMEAYKATMGWVEEQGGLYFPEEELAKINVPTLIINGKDDKVIPPEAAWRLSQTISHSWLYIIPNCGHWAMKEKPDDFFYHTMYFLENA